MSVDIAPCNCDGMCPICSISSIILHKRRRLARNRAWRSGAGALRPKLRPHSVESFCIPFEGELGRWVQGPPCRRSGESIVGEPQCEHPKS
eukprot:6935188-Pyramimonas_sp.AAC.1